MSTELLFEEIVRTAPACKYVKRNGVQFPLFMYVSLAYSLLCVGRIEDAAIQVRRLNAEYGRLVVQEIEKRESEILYKVAVAINSFIGEFEEESEAASVDKDTAVARIKLFNKEEVEQELEAEE